jgi:2,3-dimethylmalate lyase
MTNAKELRKRIVAGDPLIIPGAHDAMSARLIEEAGYEAVYLSSHGISASFLAQPDYGLETFQELVMISRNIVPAVDLPLIVDGEAGFGNVLNLKRTLRELENAGAAGMHIDDQVTPIKCPWLIGGISSAVIPLEEMVGKIHAVLDSRRDSDFVLIVRSQVLNTEYDRQGRYLEEQIRRAQAYKKAGADVILCTGKSVADLKTIAGEVPGPLMTHLSPYSPKGKTPFQDLFSMGYRILTVPVTLLYTAIKAQMDMLETLKREGRFTDEMVDKMVAHETYGEICGAKTLQAFAERYGMPEAEHALTATDCLTDHAYRHGNEHRK